MANVIHFATRQARDLWEHEISGQISDGAWENDRNTEEWWRNTEVVVDGKVGHDWWERRNSYGISRLKQWIGDRMVDIVKYSQVLEYQFPEIKNQEDIDAILEGADGSWSMEKYAIPTLEKYGISIEVWNQACENSPVQEWSDIQPFLKEISTMFKTRNPDSLYPNKKTYSSNPTVSKEERTEQKLAKPSTNEEKMLAWQAGTRGFNAKAAGTEKLYTNLEICKKIGFKDGFDTIRDELLLRGERPAAKIKFTESSMSGYFTGVCDKCHTFGNVKYVGYKGTQLCMKCSKGR